MINFKIAETEDYEKLVPFFIENDLEFSEEEPVPTDLVKCWEIVENVDAEEQLLKRRDAKRATGAADALDSSDESRGYSRLIGGFVLAKREGEFIVDGIAIAPDYRKHKLGRVLLNKGIEETLKQGGSRIFLVARAPGFFRKAGFVTVPREEAPNFFECLTCPQYGVDCHPEVMRLDLA
ncbi:MAG: GNAT family N-acetyltransferase [Bacillota bacterium]|nr:GNAT family N-acetyltransferase [Bacillota bacterium]